MRPEVFDAEGAKNFLLEGNRRFVEAKPEKPDESEEYRLALSQAQSPFAVILSCADSRLVKKNVDAGKLQVVTGYYSLDTGVVTLG